MKTLAKDSLVREYFWLWPLFSFQAGLINSGGFVACQRFVSHITGFGTRVGAEFLQSKYVLGFEMLLIPTGFIIGCTISGYFREVRNNWKDPLYLISGLLIIISVSGALGIFGTFGEPLELQRDFLLLFLLCLSCGLQNGMLASLTGGVIRTTHLTGIATDIGLGLVRTLKRGDGEKEWLTQRILKLLLFSIGATLGTFIFTYFAFGAFLVPAFTNIVLIWILSSKINQKA